MHCADDQRDKKYRLSRANHRFGVVMTHRIQRLVLCFVLLATSALLSGCLISNLSSSTSGGITTLQATATVLQPSPCTVNTAAQTTTCTPVMEVALPTGGTQNFPFLIELLGYAAPLTLYDPLIVQVPATMSNFAGSITAGPPGVAPGTPLSVTAGLTSVPIDATTNLVAEPGMQLVILDFPTPTGAANGTYTFRLQFSGTTNSIKAVFAAKLAAGANTYYLPIFPCVTSFANVPAISLPLANLNGLIPIVLSAQGCNGRMYNFAGLGPTTINLNQHGLTGSWYQPATSGQGIEVEVYPNLAAGASGNAQVSWFTYDTVAGGPERQRWYTLGGAVPTGQPAALTIYQNVGGNFNALPVTNAQAVGTASLSFDSCTSGQLSYTFSDGSGRTGTIPLTRITQSVTCSATGASTTNADFALSGNWYDPTTSGQGITVEINPTSNALFLAWYTYAPGGASAGAAGQRWYTAQATFTAGARSIPVQIYQTTGGVFNTSTATPPTTVSVGSGTLSFQSCTSATLSYNFTGATNGGASGTIALSRVGPVPVGCNF
jgi:hypothetical protein